MQTPPLISQSTASSLRVKKAVVSAGGVLSDGLLASQTASGVKSVFAPKLSGLNNLVSATFAAALRGIAAFSSVAAFIGSAGQASYAAANAAMDARLSEMVTAGLPGTLLSSFLHPAMLLKLTATR